MIFLFINFHEISNNYIKYVAFNTVVRFIHRLNIILSSLIHHSHLMLCHTKIKEIKRAQMATAI